jgi:hypothetical protein
MTWLPTSLIALKNRAIAWLFMGRLC